VRDLATFIFAGGLRGLSSQLLGRRSEERSFQKSLVDRVRATRAKWAPSASTQHVLET